MTIPPAFAPVTAVDAVIDAACAGATPHVDVVPHYSASPVLHSLDDAAATLPHRGNGPVYVAGPMSGYDNYNYDTFHAVSHALRARGIGVASPAEDTPGVYAPAPDRRTVTPEVHAAYLRRGFAYLVNCAAVVLLPGWQRSIGTQHELHVAYAAGEIPAFILDEAAVEAARKEFAQRGSYITSSADAQR